MNLKKAAQKKLKKSGGFTLVEMLIVVAIIAILVVVSIPMVSSSLDKARTATDDANERAAKAAALITYMNSGSTTGETYYYNADTGIAETTAPTKDSSGFSYGQGSDGRNNKDSYITVTVSPDGTIPATDGISWNKKPTT